MNNVLVIGFSVVVLANCAGQASLAAHPTASTGIQAPTVLEVFPNKSAAIAGIKSGSRIISVDGIRAANSEVLIGLIHVRKAIPTTLVVVESGKSRSITVTPDTEGRIGIRLTDLNDAIAAAPSKQSVPIYSSVDALISSSKSPRAPDSVRELPANAPVKVLYEEPMHSSSSSADLFPVCKLQLVKDIPGAKGASIQKGFYYTKSAYLAPMKKASEHLKSSITFKQANSLRADMPIAEVSQILKCDGAEVFKSVFKKTKTQTRSWQNINGAYLRCNFENGRLTYKSAFLLK